MMGLCSTCQMSTQCYDCATKYKPQKPEPIVKEITFYDSNNPRSINTPTQADTKPLQGMPDMPF